MSVLDRILARAASLGSRKADSAASITYPRWLTATAGADKWALPDLAQTEQQAQLYAKLLWIQIAVGTVARAAATTPFEVRREAGEDSTPIVNHPFELLLKNPNPLQSRFTFLESTFAWRRVTGNAYWFLNRAGPDAPPEELWVIPASKIQPIPDGQSFISGYLFDAGGNTKITLAPWEVCHFKTWNPRNAYVGLSPLEALALDAYGDLGAQKFNAAFYNKDNAKMDGILAFADAIDQPRWDRLRADIDSEHGGNKQKRMLMLRNVGPGGVQWIPTSLSRVDMQYLAQRDFTKEEIYAEFAPGLAAALAINANEANARSGQALLREYAIYPDHVAVAEQIANDILPSYGDGLVGEFEDVRQKDRQLELEEIREYARFHTIAEVRAKYYGDDKVKDYHDDLFVAELKPTGDPTVTPPAPMLPPIQGPPGADAAQIAADMQVAGKALDRRRWREKATKAVAAGKSAAVPFDPDYLSDGEALSITAALRRAQTADDLSAAFREDK